MWGTKAVWCVCLQYIGICWGNVLIRGAYSIDSSVRTNTLIMRWNG